MSQEYRYVQVRCPYCGTDQQIQITRAEENHPKLVLCDSEAVPGCDQYFVALIRFEPIVMDICKLVSVNE